jgi:tetratricopeptide (TPR) repeat protein
MLLVVLNSGQLSGDDRQFAYSERGKAYLEKGEFAAAISDLKRAVQLKPDDADAEQELIEAESRQSDGQGRRENSHDRSAAGAESAEQATADANAGMSALERGDDAQAIAMFSRAIESGTLNPDDSELALVSRGKAYLQKGDNNGAVADLGKALHMNANDQEAQAAFQQALSGVHAQNYVTPVDRETCKSTWSSTGSFSIGKTYMVSATYPNLYTTEAFAGVYSFLSSPASAQYGGFSITKLDFDQGTISARDAVPGTNVAVTIDVKIEPAGAGSKTTLVETVDPFVVSINLQGRLCSFLDQVAKG